MKSSSDPIDLTVMQATLKNTRQLLGKQTERHHFANEVRIINFAATGSCFQSYRHIPSNRELANAIRRVVCLNDELIQQQVQYHARKNACRALFLRISAGDSESTKPTDIGATK